LRKKPKSTIPSEEIEGLRFTIYYLSKYSGGYARLVVSLSKSIRRKQSGYRNTKKSG
jgi:hypothetical protein